MPTIDHKMMSHRQGKPDKNLKPATNMPVFTVDDATAEQELFDEEMESVRNVIEGPEPEDEDLLLDPLLRADLDKKQALEKLLLFKKPHIKEVEVGEVIFKMKLLNSRENNEVYKELLRLDEDEQLTKTSLMILSAALVEANGIKL
ncbi:MAG: hypothetical protein ACXABY_36745, partial [Candidatus Thorarchaeota archaeon]